MTIETVDGIQVLLVGFCFSSLKSEEASLHFKGHYAPKQRIRPASGLGLSVYGVSGPTVYMQVIEIVY